MRRLLEVGQRGPRWRYAVILGLVILAAFAIWSAVSPSASGDPGGRILVELQPVGYAVPKNSQIVYRNDAEPLWDSCDARPGTFGWDAVVVQIHFRSPFSSADIESNADAQMRKLGWMPDDRSSTSIPAVAWTKQLQNVTEAKAHLELEGDGAWTLIASAPPVGPRAHGC